MTHYSMLSSLNTPESAHYLSLPHDLYPMMTASEGGEVPKPWRPGQEIPRTTLLLYSGPYARYQAILYLSENHQAEAGRKRRGFPASCSNDVLHGAL